MRARLAPLIVLALLACGLAGCGGSGSEPSTMETTGRPPAGSPPDLAEGYAVFRGPRGPEDELPRGIVPPRVAAALQLNLSQSRFARDLYGEGVYLVPTPRMICLYSGNEAVGSCWPAGTVAMGSAIATTLCGPGIGADNVVTFGIVPDGVRNVTVVRTNVPSRTVAVEGNLFVAKTSSEPPLPLRVVWSRDGVRTVKSAGIPARIAREGCVPPPGVGRR